MIPIYFVLVGLEVMLGCHSWAHSTQKPNIVFILADDLGWNDVSFHGSDQIPTPNLDALAYDGVLLSNYYVQPICTPTRSALMTGKYPIRLGMQHGVLVSAAPYGLGLNETLMPQMLNKMGYSTHIVGKYFAGLQHRTIESSHPYGLDFNEVLLPQILKTLGYGTHIVGKWHLGFFTKKHTPPLRGFDSFYGFYTGCADYWDHVNAESEARKYGWHLGFYSKEYTPTMRGFDTHFGYYQGCGDYFDHTYKPDVELKAWGLDLHDQNEMVRDQFGQYSTEIFTTRAVQIVESHNTSQPLFLYFPHQAVHSGNPFTANPLEAPWKYQQKFQHIQHYGRRTFASMLSALDDSVGNLTKALHQRGMLNNTIIVFSTDNGGPAGGFDLNFANNYPLRGLKSTLWEGGIRGDGFVWSPLLKKPGVASSAMIHVTDWLPTLLTAAGYTGSIPSQLDGIDMWQVLQQGINSSPRKQILHNIDPVEDSWAVRKDHMKLIFAKKGCSTYKYNNWYKPESYTEPGNKGKGKVLQSKTDIHLKMYPDAKNVDELNEMIMGRLNDVDMESVEIVKEHAPNELFSSEIPAILRSLGRPTHTPHPYVVKCGPRPENYSINCDPGTVPCLYNITADPCEYNNIAASQPNIVAELFDLYQSYIKVMVKPLNKPSDPKGLPYYHNGFWEPWIQSGNL